LRDIDRIKGVALALAWLFVVTSCTPADPVPPWETAEMVRELTSDLRLFEGLQSEFTDVVILAWRIDTRPGVAVLPRIPLPDGSGFVPPKEERVEIALLWGQTGPDRAPTGWAVVQGFRHPGSGKPWQRAIINRSLSAPLTDLRPGEEPDGTWHGYVRYDRPPTSRDACDFAAVDFLVGAHSWHRIAGAVRSRSWAHALGGEPACGFADNPVANRR
jgi:hypothetical protein